MRLSAGQRYPVASHPRLIRGRPSHCLLLPFAHVLVPGPRGTKGDFSQTRPLEGSRRGTQTTEATSEEMGYSFAIRQMEASGESDRYLVCLCSHANEPSRMACFSCS